MSDITLQPDQLRQAADVFSGAGKDTQAILKKLDDATSELEKHWDGVNQQVFYKQYRELRQYMQGFSGLLANISTEMQAMAQRFEDADR